MLGFAALALVACGRPPSPRGWAAPEPVDADSVTIVPHKKTLYAIQKDTAQTELVWQFPPKDREQYGLSENSVAELIGLAANLDLGDADTRAIDDLIRGTNVGGPTVDTLKDEVEATASESDARSAFLDRVDEIVDEERKALRGVRAFYGDLGVSGDGSTAYAASYGGWLFALDVETGATQWILDLDPMVGGVLVDGAQIYVGTKAGDVYSITDGGSIAFERELDGEVWGSPARAYDGDGIFVPTLEGSLYRLSDTFDVMWTFDDTDGALAQTPLVDSDRVFVGGFDSTLYAISSDTGNEVWTIEAGNWFWGEPVIEDGTLYAPSLDGKVYAVDAQTGDARWRRPFDTEDQVRSGLVVAGDALIVGSRDGFVHRVSLDDGTEIGDALQVGSRLEADLSTDGEGKVYAISRSPVLYVIDAGDTLSAEFYHLD